MDFVSMNQSFVDLLNGCYSFIQWKINFFLDSIEMIAHKLTSEQKKIEATSESFDNILIIR